MGLSGETLLRSLPLEERFEESEGTSYVNVWGGGVIFQTRRANTELQRPKCAWYVQESSLSGEYEQGEDRK